MTTLVGVAQRGWSQHIRDLSHLGVSFLSFFLSFFAFFATRPRRISWPIGTIYTSKRVFSSKDVPFGGLDNIWQQSGGQTPQKTAPKLARIGISQPNQRRDKMAIYLSPMNIFVSILTDIFTTRGINKKCKIKSIGVIWESRDPILELWDPLVSRER